MNRKKNTIYKRFFLNAKRYQPAKPCCLKYLLRTLERIIHDKKSAYTNAHGQPKLENSFSLKSFANI